MMKSIMKRAASAVLATALVVTSVYCGGTDASAAVKAKKITMNKKTVNLVVGKKFTLKVKKVTPKKGSKAVTYKTSSKKVCTVSKKGVILAKAEGKAVITVTSKSNKKAKAQVRVTVRKATPAATATPTVAPTATATATANVAAPTATATVVPGTPSPKPTKKPTGTPKPTPTAKPAADTKPTEDVLDVTAMTYLDVADGVKATYNDDGSVTLDYSGTSYKGARWYFGTRETKEENGEVVNTDTQTPLDLTGYSYLVIEGKGQDGIPVGENHDLKTQLLDATDHADHGGLLEIDTQDLPSQLPFAFDLTGIRQDVAAFEIYSLGDDQSAKAGPITITGVYICKDKAAYDKFKAGGDDNDNNGEVATPGAIDLSKASSYLIDDAAGPGTAATYNADNKELNASVNQFTGIVFKNAETDVDDYKYVKLTYKASAGFDAYVFNGQMGDEGKGQTPAGQTKVDSLVASDTYKTVVFNTEKMYGLKIVNMGGTATIDIKAVEFSKTEPSAE